MANQITDNRTLVTNADTVTGFTDLGGGAAGTQDAEIRVQGTASVGYYTTTSRDGLLYNLGSPTDLTGNVIYLWINCGIVGLLDTKANGGFRIRFAGATATNFFEVNVAGSDDWPTAVSGGWVQFVVDVGLASSNADATGGTPPAVTAIQRIGYSAITAATMPRMADNTWVDEIRRLPANTPAAIVEGRNGGVTDWNFGDIVTQLGVGSGVAKNGPGGSVVLNGPIQIGINDTTTHGFTATNRAVLWDNQEFVADNFYGISALGNAGGTTNVTLGVKSGTGNDATGSQGGIIQAASTGARFGLDFSDPNLDTIGLHGVTFNHAGTIDFSGGAETTSCIFVDCTSVDNTTGGKFVRNTVVDANTADGVAFLTSDDPSDIAFSSFSFSDGHAVEFTTTGTFTFVGNSFAGYGANGTNDAAIYNNSGGLITLNLQEVAAAPTVRNGAGASTNADITVTVRVTARDDVGADIEGARALLFAASGGDLPAGASVTITRSGSTASVSHTAHGMLNGQQVIIDGADQPEYNGIFTITNVTTNAYDYTVSGTPTSPATGTITSTAVVLTGLTNAQGQIEDTGFVFTNPQPVQGRLRRGTTSPLYRNAPFTGTIVSTGFDATVTMVSDE